MTNNSIINEIANCNWISKPVFLVHKIDDNKLKNLYLEIPEILELGLETSEKESLILGMLEIFKKVNSFTTLFMEVCMHTHDFIERLPFLDPGYYLVTKKGTKKTFLATIKMENYSDQSPNGIKNIQFPKVELMMHQVDFLNHCLTLH